MAELFTNVMANVRDYYPELILVGAIMVCSIIFIVGAMKPVLFNKIANKQLRKFLLALSDVVGAFAATAIYFVAKGINWQYYWIASAITTVATVFVYWLYECTPCRSVIDKIGTIAIKKIVKMGLVLFTENEKYKVEKELGKLATELKNEAINELGKSAKYADKELNKL